MELNQVQLLYNLILNLVNIIHSYKLMKYAQYQFFILLFIPLIDLQMNFWSKVKIRNFNQNINLFNKITIILFKKKIMEQTRHFNNTQLYQLRIKNKLKIINILKISNKARVKLQNKFKMILKVRMHTVRKQVFFQ